MEEQLNPKSRIDQLLVLKRNVILQKQMIDIEESERVKRLHKKRIMQTSILNAPDQKTKDEYQLEWEAIQRRWIEDDEEARYKESEAKVTFSKHDDVGYDNEDDEAFQLKANPLKHQVYDLIVKGDEKEAISLIALNRPQMSTEHDIFGHSLMHYAVLHKRQKVYSFIRKRVKQGLSDRAYR